MKTLRFALILSILVILLTVTSACIKPPKSPFDPDSPPPTANNGKSKQASANGDYVVYQKKQPPYVKTTGGPKVKLVNNDLATDPTWRQLLEWLEYDDTDSKPYSLESFPCGAFAEEVHNNAEAAGFKAAWVAIDFLENDLGHALNAFNTTDRGLVFIDCTGEGLMASPIVIPGDGQTTYGLPPSNDKVAYVELDKQYGCINVEVASSFGYAAYLEHRQQREKFETGLADHNANVQAFNEDVKQYNDWIRGRQIYEGTADARKADNWYSELNMKEQELRIREKQLDDLGQGLGGFWQPLDTVIKILIYW
jgi:hypothetical protein